MLLVSFFVCLFLFTCSLQFESRQKNSCCGCVSYQSALRRFLYLTIDCGNPQRRCVLVYACEHQGSSLHICCIKPAGPQPHKAWVHGARWGLCGRLWRRVKQSSHHVYTDIKIQKPHPTLLCLWLFWLLNRFIVASKPAAQRGWNQKRGC